MKKTPLKDPQAAREAAQYDNPIPSRELITQLLEQAPGPLGFKPLLKQLDISGEERTEALRRRLRAMERDGQLISNRKNEYGLTDKMDLVRGRVQGHRDGFGFLIPADGSPDLYLTSRQMQKVFDGDEALVSPGSADFKGRREGKIVEVLAHNTTQLVGRYVMQSGAAFVRPDNPRVNHDVIIPPEHSANAQAGQFVVVEILQQPGRYQKPEGRIAEVLGEHMAPGMEIDVAIRSHSVPHVWPEEVTQQAEGLSAEVDEADKKYRVDLRKLPFVTIDGEDARDFDDAVYCEKKRWGGWRLFVAIADVAHYVTPNSALDREAIVRGNSVYFPDHVVPMLPHALSNGLCSLNPHVDRLSMVCEMTITRGGKISGFTFYEGVIHSHARLTYTQVGQMIADREKSQSEVRDQYESLLPQIDELYKLYLTLRERRELRGAIDFESNETRIVFDETRKIEKIVPVQRNDAHKLIEECMLAANVCTANFLEAEKIPVLYRVHEPPSNDKLDMLKEFLGGMGVSMKGKGQVTPQDYRDVLAQVAGRPEAHLIQTVMLRSMSQARYQPENLGHFGLAYSAYAHFTSPIRRYPDLLVHRAIRATIRSGKSSKRVQRVRGATKVAFKENYPYEAADMLNFGEICSTTERRADDATRDVISWLKCEYLQDRVGEEFNGVVTAVTSFGLFVELENIYVEGLVHITALPRDYYHHEAAHHRLVGERTRQVFRISDAVKVKVMRVDLDERKIDFELVEAKTKSGGKATKTSGAPPSSDKTSTGRKVRKRSSSRKRTPSGDAKSGKNPEPNSQGKGSTQSKAVKDTKSTENASAANSRKRATSNSDKPKAPRKKPSTPRNKPSN